MRIVSTPGGNAPPSGSAIATVPQVDHFVEWHHVEYLGQPHPSGLHRRLASDSTQTVTLTLRSNRIPAHHTARAIHESDCGCTYFGEFLDDPFRPIPLRDRH